MEKYMEQNNMFIKCWTQLKVNGTLEPKCYKSLSMTISNRVVDQLSAYVV